MKAFIQEQFNQAVAHAYLSPSGIGRRVIGGLFAGWPLLDYAPFYALRRYARRRIKRAIALNTECLQARDLGLLPVGFGDLVVQAFSSDLVTASLYFSAPRHSVYALYRQLVRPGSWAVDVGTNIGVHASVLSRCVGPEGRVLAFEPAPRIFARAQTNLAANRITNVELANLALADSEGEIGFADISDQANTGLSRIDPGAEFKVPVALLDQRVPDHADVSLIKIDVEGFEPSVLRGAQKTLARCRPSVILEMNLHHYGWREIVGAFPYPVKLSWLPDRRPSKPTPIEATDKAIAALDKHHFDLLIQPVDAP